MGAPIILAMAGAAIMLLSGKKRIKSDRSSYSKFKYKKEYKSTIPECFIGEGSNSSLTDRQIALKIISEIEFPLKNGGSISLCSKCDPINIDGNASASTDAAIRAFQAISGMEVNGQWSHLEDRAMRRILNSISQGSAIECDPNLDYPTPFSCFANGEEYSIAIDLSNSLKPFINKGEYSSEDVLITDDNCDDIIYQSDEWDRDISIRIVKHALSGMTGSNFSNEIVESMLSEYAPICLSLGIDGVGDGVREFWLSNISKISESFNKYEESPEKLEEDAILLGLL